MHYKLNISKYNCFNIYIDFKLTFCFLDFIYMNSYIIVWDLNNQSDVSQAQNQRYFSLFFQVMYITYESSGIWIFIRMFPMFSDSSLTN